MQPDSHVIPMSTTASASCATLPKIICCDVVPLPGAPNTYAITVPYALGNGDVLAGFFEVTRAGRITPRPFPGGYGKETIAAVGSAAGLRHLAPEDWKAEHAAS